MDVINHPVHYTDHPTGIECIDVIEEMAYNVGAAIKYLWRVDLKDEPIENLEKAKWHIQREIERRQRQLAKRAYVREYGSGPTKVDGHV